MNREIKFRAWDKDKKEMFTGFSIEDLFTDMDDSWIDADCDDNKTLSNATNYENKILMQYTGLKDKNGKEIYEGDIYNYMGEIGVFESIEEFYYNELIRYRVENGEIIGNIYENKDLIK